MAGGSGLPLYWAAPSREQLAACERSQTSSSLILSKQEKVTAVTGRSATGISEKQHNIFVLFMTFKNMNNAFV